MFGLFHSTIKLHGPASHHKSGTAQCTYHALLQPAWAEPQTREYIDWHWPLSCVHSITMVFSVQVIEGGGKHAMPFSLSLPSRLELNVVPYTPSRAKLAREGYLKREFKSEIESANPAKQANPSYFTMLSGIGCE
jgi:hypothetical protein